MSNPYHLSPGEKPNLLRAALEYAKLGIPVFPCDRETKRPLLKTGFLEAVSDPVTITGWWRKFPQASIGIPTGDKSGIVALDIDLPLGQASLDALTAQYGALPKTRKQITGSGGMHYLFEAPDGEFELRNSAGRLGKNNAIS